MSGPFARISSGPTGTTDTNKQALIFDKTNNIVSSVGDSGNVQAHQTCALVLAAQTALTTITTAQNLLSLAFPAGALNVVNRVITVTISGIYTSPGTTTPTLTFVVKLGGVTLCTITTTGVSSTLSTNMPFTLQFTLQVVTNGATATLETHGIAMVNLTANTPAAGVTQFNDTNVAVSSAVNLVTAATLLVTIAASSTITSAQARQTTVEMVA